MCWARLCRPRKAVDCEGANVKGASTSSFLVKVLSWALGDHLFLMSFYEEFVVFPLSPESILCYLFVQV